MKSCLEEKTFLVLDSEAEKPAKTRSGGFFLVVNFFEAHTMYVNISYLYYLIS